MVKLIKFILVGGLGVTLNLGIYFLLVQFGGMHYLAGSILSVALSTVFGFLMQKYWTFGDSRHHMAMSQFVKYLIVALFNLLLNTLIVYVLVDDFHVFYLVAQFIAAGLVAVNSFFVYNRFVFVAMSEKSVESI